MDRLVGEGISFEDCFITAASCAPARASLFTGYYPHTTGIYKMQILGSVRGLRSYLILGIAV